MSHGGDIYKYAKILNCEPSEIVDFSSNINFYVPNESLTFDNGVIQKYAQSSYDELKKVIANNYAIKPKEIALFNGATAAIYALMTQLKKKRVYLYAPLYGEYEKAATFAKKDIYKLSRVADIDEDEIEEKSIVVFVNPATPEGSFYELEEELELWKSKNSTIIIDESFLEFEAHPSLREQIKEYKKLYIIQSFSKFYSCAGVRIGAVFANKKSIKKLHTPLWNISSLDATFLMQRMQDEAFKTTSRELHAVQKAELKQILSDSGHFEQIITSDANFFLVKSQKAEAIFSHLLEHKILTRRCFNFDYLDNTYLRFAVKDKASHKMLKEALDALS